MRPSSLQTSFAIFILFFGLSLLEAVEDRAWLTAALWSSAGIAFLILGSRRKSNNI